MGMPFLARKLRYTVGGKYTRGAGNFFRRKGSSHPKPNWQKAGRCLAGLHRPGDFSTHMEPIFSGPT
jgi:hypothetical protein